MSKHAVIDLVGQKYNRLTVIEFAGWKGNDKYWKCLCDCGNEKTVQQGSLRFGSIKSCGCLLRETAAKIGGSNRKTAEEKKLVKQRNNRLYDSRKKSAVNDLTKEDVEFLYRGIQDGKCPSCGEYLDNYHIDHIIPVSKGGGLTVTNVQLLCPHCNLVKSAKDTDYLARYIYRKVFHDKDSWT